MSETYKEMMAREQNQGNKTDVSDIEYPDFPDFKACHKQFDKEKFKAILITKDTEAGE